LNERRDRWKNRRREEDIGKVEEERKRILGRTEEEYSIR
jgi:hypothetical protein